MATIEEVQQERKAFRTQKEDLSPEDVAARKALLEKYRRFSGPPLSIRMVHPIQLLPKRLRQSEVHPLTDEQVHQIEEAGRQARERLAKRFKSFQPPAVE